MLVCLENVDELCVGNWKIFCFSTNLLHFFMIPIDPADMIEASDMNNAFVHRELYLC
jgi:hypothetical protein